MIRIFNSGGVQSKCQSLISYDSKYVLHGIGPQVRVVSIVTGLIVRSLDLDSEKLNEATVVVKSIQMHSSDKAQIVVAYSHGLVVLWDYSTGSMMKVSPSK